MIKDNWGHYVILCLAALLVTVLCGLLSKGDSRVIILVLILFLLLFWSATFVLAPQIKRNQIKRNRKTQTVSIPGDPDKLDELYSDSLSYCNDLIDYYNGARYRMRIYYILSQLAIALLTGLTPILVLIEQQLVSVSWFKWLPIIVPGVASIVASVSTIFHFQEEWVQAKTTAEALEALLQEYRVGVPETFHISATTEPQKTLERKRALEKLIVMVNQIHLRQTESWASLQRAVNGNSQSSTPSDGDIGITEDATRSDRSFRTESSQFNHRVRSQGNHTQLEGSEENSDFFNSQADTDTLSSAEKKPDLSESLDSTFQDDFDF